MSQQAVLMLLFAILVLGGGLSVCIGIAVAVDRRKREDGISFSSDEE